jgi:hypothetical protein
MTYTDGPPVELRLGKTVVAEYVTTPRVDPLRGPRPFLHPVRTLSGTVVTDVLPEDHPHHLGVSVAMQDVNGTNLWGGRTYVRDEGYAWRDDHGRIEHTAWRERDAAHLAAGLRWFGRAGEALLDEVRTMTAAPHPTDPSAWVLDVAYRLTNPGPAPAVLASPATNGRPGKTGYGGFFWRAAPGIPRVFDPDSDVEEHVNGSAAPWVALVGDGYSLVFTGLGDGDRWFVRATEYPGVCVALAFDRVRTIAPDTGIDRRHRIVVADGPRTPAEAATLVAALT